MRLFVLALPVVFAALPAHAWSLQGVRIGNVNINGTPGTQTILNSYTPNIREQLRNAGIVATGEPSDFTLNIIVMQMYFLVTSCFVHKPSWRARDVSARPIVRTTNARDTC